MTFALYSREAKPLNMPEAALHVTNEFAVLNDSLGYVELKNFGTQAEGAVFGAFWAKIQDGAHFSENCRNSKMFFSKVVENSILRNISSSKKCLKPILRPTKIF